VRIHYSRSIHFCCLAVVWRALFNNFTARSRGRGTESMRTSVQPATKSETATGRRQLPLQMVNHISFAVRDVHKVGCTRPPQSHCTGDLAFQLARPFKYLGNDMISNSGWPVCACAFESTMPFAPMIVVFFLGSRILCE
jgi:hypothetical protein